MILVQVPLSRQRLFATSAVAIYTNEFIVIGSDSRINSLGPKLKSHHTACKIYVRHGYVAIAAGLASDPTTGFDLARDLMVAMDSGRSVYEAADLAERKIASSLPKAVEDLKAKQPEEFERHLRGYYLQFLIAGTDAGGQTRIATRFVPYTGTGTADSTKRENLTGVEGRVGIAVLGESEAANRYVDYLHSSNGWAQHGSENDAVNVVKRIVNLEISDQPERVGAPISILVMKKDGIHWVCKGLCRR